MWRPPCWLLCLGWDLGWCGEAPRLQPRLDKRVDSGTWDPSPSFFCPQELADCPGCPGLARDHALFLTLPLRGLDGGKAHTRMYDMRATSRSTCVPGEGCGSFWSALSLTWVSGDRGLCERSHSARHLWTLDRDGQRQPMDHTPPTAQFLPVL